MVQIGEQVRLLSQIGDFPPGTVAVVVSVTGDLCDIEIGGNRLTIDCSAVAVIDPPRSAKPS